MYVGCKLHAAGFDVRKQIYAASVTVDEEGEHEPVGCGGGLTAMQIFAIRISLRNVKAFVIVDSRLIQRVRHSDT